MKQPLGMFRSATLKLTLWYLTIALTISVIFSAALYQVASRELHGQLNHEYQRYHRLTVNALDDDPPPLPQPTEEFRDGSRHILLQLLYINLLVLIGAGFISYGLARRTLGPLEVAHEQQKRFTADVSHELRTPLTALKMETEVSLLEPKASKAQLQATLRSNLEETNKLEALINNLLRLAQLDQPAARADFSHLRFDHVLSDALAQLQPLAAKRSIVLDAKVAPVTVNGDATYLMQLVTIIIDNALKYSPNGAVIEIRTTSQAKQTVLKISDHGQGISAQALPHVFERFYRADAARSKQNGEGYGLGLSLAKQLVELHGGTIHIVSSDQADSGTTVTITLPIIN